MHAQPDRGLRRPKVMMTGALLACALLLAGQEAGAPAQPTQELPVSLDRIQRALAGPPPIQLKEQQPVFRLEVFGRKPTIEDILGENFWVGPAPYGSRIRGSRAGICSRRPR
jgi:hypothetical protein